MTYNLMPKNAENFYCEKCDFGCSKRSNYEKHLLTRKHEILTNTYNKTPKNAEYVCECGKKYKHRQSLNNHMKKCKFKMSSLGEEILTESTLEKPTMEYLLEENLKIKKDNLEIKNMMINLCKNIGPVSNNTNINSNNTNNNIFNIQLFLNEDCKDAMNMTEFIESIQLTLEDIATINLEGQTQAMSNILINKLNDLDILKRPLHCSDSKKEIIYVKDQDKWEQEGKDKSKIKKALDKITMKSIETLPTIAVDPDDYVNTVNELLKEPREDKKIISNIAREILC